MRKFGGLNFLEQQHLFERAIRDEFRLFLNENRDAIIAQAPPPAKPPVVNSDVKVRVLPDGRMSRADAARYLGVEPKTMAEWQRLSKGPLARKVGGRVFYHIRDLDDYAGA